MNSSLTQDRNFPEKMFEENESLLQGEFVWTKTIQLFKIKAIGIKPTG